MTQRHRAKERQSYPEIQRDREIQRYGDRDNQKYREAERRERRQEERDGPAILTTSERMNEHVPRRFIQPNMRRMHR